jgi:hypothetical protein
VTYSCRNLFTLSTRSRNVNKGFIQLSLMGWLAVGATVLFLGMSLALKVQTARLEASEAKYATFVAQVRTEGEAAKKAAKEQTEKDLKRKKEADNENQVNRKRIADLTQRLRERPAGGQLPPAPSGSKRPELACFDRSEYSGAYGKLIEGLRGLADEGTAATLDLDTAKAWAK